MHKTNIKNIKNQASNDDKQTLTGMSQKFTNNPQILHNYLNSFLKFSMSNAAKVHFKFYQI